MNRRDIIITIDRRATIIAILVTMGTVILFEKSILNLRFLHEIFVRFGLVLDSKELWETVMDDEKMFEGVSKMLLTDWGLIIRWEYEKMHGVMLYEWLALGD